jgi:hypothetical protein
MTFSDAGMLWFQRLDPVALRCHSHGVAAIFLLVLLAQQGTGQQADDKVTVSAMYYANNLLCKSKVVYVFK